MVKELQKKELGWKRIAFSVAVLAYVGFLALINILMFMPGNSLSAMGHFDFVYTGETHNLIHELVFALVIGTAAVGLVSQLWKPKESASWRIAGQLVALIAWVAMIVTAIFTKNLVPQPLFIIFGGLTLIATIFHPTGRGLFNWVRTAKVNKALLALVIIAAVPLLFFAVTNINLQRAGTNMHQNKSGEFLSLFGHKIPRHGDSKDTATDAAVHDEMHAAEGHYRNVAALSFTIIMVGLLASFRPPAGGGWHLAAWLAGLLPIALGLASIMLPNAESSLELGWALAAIAWGIAFISTAELTKHRAAEEITPA
jgi:hypothetical protein